MKAQRDRKPRIFVLDSNPTILDYVQRILSDLYIVSRFVRGEELIDSMTQLSAPDVLLMEWQVPDGEGGPDSQGILHRIHQSWPTLPIAILACSTYVKEAVVAARAGAEDVILKPFRRDDVEAVVEKALSMSRGIDREEDNQVRVIPLGEDASFVVASKRMREIESQCRLVARVDIPVLILGESGTGKEVATMFIHKLSSRSNREFLKVNCAAMPGDLLESELFGYEQGAFTGAVRSKPGKFELCNGGTIFLDEIGEMPAHLQAKMLQVLQDGSFSRLGGRNSIRVDVRVIAATNIDMKAALAQKLFREDLYYRLNGFTVKMPPLRERAEEIPILAHHFVRKLAATCLCDPPSISPSLMHSLCRHPWPGNLRELENIVKRLLILGDENAIISELAPPIEFDLGASSGEALDAGSGLKNLVRNLKGDAESVAIAQALENLGWNRKLAASELKISYKALLYKIKQYNLSPRQIRYPARALPNKRNVEASEVA